MAQCTGRWAQSLWGPLRVSCVESAQTRPLEEEVGWECLQQACSHLFRALGWFWGAEDGGWEKSVMAAGILQAGPRAPGVGHLIFPATSWGR